ncbi:phosphopyruvate hydratase [Streptomyces sp. NBC_00154]|uniref:phosphopyruvate hydratase n=1 Tax=Streptomyces sp. NBC_00154 TaxID=2975670 RepID=UPI00224E6AF9|nr:phosphopyruvate hydratase [Streptomyces sp. NBC_00154]MCX5317010.1 phosphopyruvate hydratase [Streptomyces sp. NBC_00154]
MNRFTIDHVTAGLAFDSRGTPTVSCSVRLRGGAVGAAIVPSGASTGTHEAIELRDGGAAFGGRGVSAAIRSVREELAESVRGLDAHDQQAIDDALRACDGSEGLARLGANAVLAVSIAAATAGAAQAGLPLYRWCTGDREPLLPLPMVNIFSGGAHAAGALDVQDLLVVPVGAVDIEQALTWVWDVRHQVGGVLAERRIPHALVADEGGFGPPLPSTTVGLELLVAGIERVGLRPGEQMAIAMDVAASELLTEAGTYRLENEGRSLTSSELVAEAVTWCRDFPIVSIEDLLAEDDWAGWAEATKALGQIQLVGDDLFVTNPSRLRRGIDTGVGNSVLVKPNQIGTLSAARNVVTLAKSSGYATVLSARSGETEDSWLADLAVGWGTGQLKVGSMTRSERTAKWNRLLRINDELGTSARYAGADSLAGHTVGA